MGMIFLVVLIVTATISPFIFDYEKDIVTPNIEQRFIRPSASHWFGTDNFGRDLFARVLYGSRYSLMIGVGSVFLGLVVGTILELYGFKGGIVDSIIMRGVDILFHTKYYDSCSNSFATWYKHYKSSVCTCFFVRAVFPELLGQLL